MKKRLWRRIILTGMFCMTASAVCGCGSKDASAEGETVESPVEEERDTADETENVQPDTGGGPKEELEDQKDETSVPDTENRADEAAADSGPKVRRTGKEDLIGDIREIGDGQFTVVEALMEETEEGSGIMTAPVPGVDDPSFAHVTVTWDEDTLFYIRTIYDNGVRYEDTDASAEDLEDDAMILVWGIWEEDHKAMHADQVQIDEFVR